jgi:Coenzyme PQQ synthesis protein D (PqqD)
MADDRDNVDETTTIKLREEGIFWRRIDEEVVVLDTEQSTYFSLNSTASFIWDRLQTGTTLGAVIDGVVDEFGVDRAVAAADVDDFLRVCREHRFIAT